MIIEITNLISIIAIESGYQHKFPPPEKRIYIFSYTNKPIMGKVETMQINAIGTMSITHNFTLSCTNI